MRVEQVFMTPLIKENTYGNEVEVSDFVKINGLSKIKRSIDATDYSLGVYRFNDLRLKCENALGTFNENDSRSIFPFTRDKAKVRVVALKINPDDFTTVTELQFEGIINDESTRQNITNDIITMVALSKDSVFRTTQVPPGLVTTGTSARNAIFSILSQSSITTLLTVSLVNINPEFDFIIDTPSALDNLEVKEALDMILVAASSVLLIKSDVVLVQARENEVEGVTLGLKGRGEITNNANISSISEYNSGKQRQFNSIRLNDGAVVVEDTNSVLEYGLRKIDFDFPLVNDLTTLRSIGEVIAGEFKLPKIELKLKVPTEVSKGFDLLDLAQVDAPWLKKPLPGNFLPIYGTATYGDTETPYPEIFGSVQVSPYTKFKIISIEDDPKNFITTLKLRQFGKEFNDGYFTTLPGPVYGEGIYGESKYGVL